MAFRLLVHGGMVRVILTGVLVLLCTGLLERAATAVTLDADPRAAIRLERTATLYHQQGHPSIARPLLERALAIRERTLGSESLSVAGVLNRLGLVYEALGDHEHAAECFTRAVEIRTKILGDDHPTVQAVQHRLDEISFP